MSIKTPWYQNFLVILQGNGTHQQVGVALSTVSWLGCEGDSAPRAPPATDEAVVSLCPLTATASSRHHDHNTHCYYLELTDTSCISTCKTTTAHYLSLVLSSRVARAPEHCGRALTLPPTRTQSNSEHWDHALISPHTIISH